MKLERINEILNNSEIRDIYYNNRCVWIQELNKNTVKIGFIDSNEEINVPIENLYENL